MIWGYMPKLGNSATYGSWDTKMHIFRYNFWTVSQQIIILELNNLPKLGTAPPMGTWHSQKWTILLITFESTVQIFYFCIVLFPGICRFWQCLICHFPEFACQSYWSKWKTCIFATPHSSFVTFCPKSYDLWTDPHRNDWTDFWYSLPFPRNTSRKLTVPMLLSYASNLSILLSYRLNNYQSV